MTPQDLLRLRAVHRIRPFPRDFQSPVTSNGSKCLISHAASACCLFIKVIQASVQQHV